MQLLRRGDSGPAVVEIRATLRQFGLMTDPTGTPEDDRFDADTERAVRAFQQQRGLIADGIVGQATYRALREAGWTLGDRMLAPPWSPPRWAATTSSPCRSGCSSSASTPAAPAGCSTSRPSSALRKFQREYGLVPDGVCGPATLRSLRQLGPQGHRRAAAAACASRRCCASPGRGCAASGSWSTPATAAPTAAWSVAGVAEADLMWDLARRLVGRMSATGMDAMLTRQEHTCPTETERAEFANTAGADLVLSLHTDANASMHAQGLATYHFGNGNGATSTVGEALAGFIQRELLTRTAMLDCRSQARTWELLRLTRMPTVRVEVGYLTNMGDRMRLLDPAFRDVVAEGILVAVKRLYLLGQNDQPTGTFSFSDVLAHELERGGAQAI